jgi:hypothetical protein
VVRLVRLTSVNRSIWVVNRGIFSVIIWDMESIVGDGEKYFGGYMLSTLQVITGLFI